MSVLLDAGAGSIWTYHEQESGQRFSRSEGLGVASIKMFEDGLFSGDSDQPYKVDRKCLTTSLYLPVVDIIPQLLGYLG